MNRFSIDMMLPTGDGPAVQRDMTRDSLFLTAELKVAALPAEQVRVRNLSSGGLMAEYPSPIDPGVAVQVVLRGVGSVSGRVAWATEGRIGIAFDEPIDPIRARKPVATRTNPKR